MAIAMTTNNPLEEMERFFERMARQFDDFSGKWESETGFGGWALGSETMAADLAEHDETFVVTADVPGFERDDIDISVTDHTLRIDAEHEETVDDEEKRYIRRERRRRSSSRSIRLPEEVNKDDIDAQLSNGVLTVTLPKQETTEARKIEIDST